MGVHAQNEITQTIWYNQPASEWLEALPVGNGHLGAMVFSNPNTEQIQLNEDSLWPAENDWGLSEGNPEDLKEIRKQLLAGNNKKADEIFVEKFLTKDIKRSHQTMGNLYINFEDGQVSDYSRELNLQNAVVTANYKVDNTNIEQQVFASNPDDVLIINYKAKGGKGLNAKLTMDRPKDHGHQTAQSFVEGDQLVLQGETTQYGAVFKGKKDPITSGVKFDCRLKVDHKGGEVNYLDKAIELKNVQEITIYLVAISSYYHDDYQQVSKGLLERVAAKNVSAIQNEHIEDYQALYNKMKLNIAHDETSLSTDQRLTNVKNGQPDVVLDQLLFNYGRYLLISSSRPGTLPANLQGLWNKEIEAPWNADYHLNINLQMNYWLANVTNLDELNMPLFKYTDRLVENGKIAAEQNYGVRGSFLAHATDLWATSFLRSRTAYWGGSFGAGGWMMQHYWHHYLFTQDVDFLRNKAFPAMQEVAKFYSDWVIENPQSGKLVSAPSSSPENRFINEKGDTAALCLGSAKDQQVIYELFTNYLKAAEILNINNEWTKTIREKRSRLRSGIQIASDGRIMEWDREYKEFEPGHRHMSHLYAFHPGNQITVKDNPKLVEAVKKTMIHRMDHGGGHTGWSRAWLINLQARLLDAELAYENIQLLFQKSIGYNLFDLHPPFQIDGNFGYTAGVAEMLIQSHEENTVRLLPALPGAWASGSVKGIKARGNISVDMEWKNNELTSVDLTSGDDRKIELVYNGKTQPISLKKGSTIHLNHNNFK